MGASEDALRRCKEGGFNRGVRVLVNGDVFDVGTDYLQWQGLGPTENSSPPKGTVYFVGEVKGTLNAQDQLYIKFLHDNCTSRVHYKQILRVVNKDDNISPFWVNVSWLEDELHKITGVVFIGKEATPPVRFDKQNEKMLHESEKKSFSPSNSGADCSSDTTEDIPSGNLGGDLDEIDLDDPFSTPGRKKKRSRRGRPAKKTIQEGSDDEKGETSDAVNAYISGESSSDSPTDSGEEIPTSEEEETISWNPPKNWEAECRKNPEIKRYACTWFKVGDRTSLEPLRSLPNQKAHFHIKPEGLRPFAKLFLDALPESFWRNAVMQTKRYANKTRKNSSTPTVREWDEAKCTVANMLRCVCVVIMRGLVSATTDPQFFRGQSRCDGKFVIPGAASTCKIGLNLYQQLMRYLHIVDNIERLEKKNPAYDKLFHVRPLIDRLNEVFKEWVSPGKNNAVDEGGFPSRFTWLRKRDTSKPHKYFIEVLMGCDSDTKFCWHFIVVEGSSKKVARKKRNIGQSKYQSLNHYQREYDKEDIQVFDKFGASAAQMHHFARILRSLDPDLQNPVGQKSMLYRIFVDRRWDSLPGLVESFEKFDVSFTATARKDARFYAWKDMGMGNFDKKKPRSKRGKYKSATTQIGRCKINSALWSDSNLCGYVSADLGTSETKVLRRQGRHKFLISCPSIAVIRGRYFRAVDQHDQLRLGKTHFAFVCKTKPWPKVFWGLIELLLINMYIVCKQDARYEDLSQRDFRWQLVNELLNHISELTNHVEPQIQRISQPTKKVQRFHPQSVNLHHFDKMQEYVTQEEAQVMKVEMRDSPSNRYKKNIKPRRRDTKRKNGKVPNPGFFAAPCVVCWAQRTPGTRLPVTTRYCRECKMEDHWPNTMFRGKGYRKNYGPRLCSDECWEKFHAERIPGLDFGIKRKRR